MALYRKFFNGRALRELDASTYLRDPSRKQTYVTFMFDLLAPGYNAFTRVFSFGMDRRWKRRLVSSATTRLRPTGRIADLACGTADLAVLVRLDRPDATLVAMDISSEMIRVAKQIHREIPRLDFVVGDVSRLSLGTATMAGVVIGFGLRNLPSLDAGVHEVCRVLEPGGILAILDFFKPRHRLWSQVFLAYLYLFGSLAGWIWHNDPSTFAYISRSIRRFMTIEDLVLRLRSAGLLVLSVERRLGGGIGLVLAIKPSGAS